MSGYLMTLLGIVMLGVLVDIILPSGNTSKYISGIFAIFVLFVIITPVLNFVKKDYDISSYFINQDIELNEKLLYNINSSKFKALEKDIEDELNDAGLENVKLQIKYKMVAENVEIEEVIADLTNLVINKKAENINKYVYIRQAVMRHLSISEEVVKFCE